MDKATKQRIGLSEDNPTQWFEKIYQSTDCSGTGVPWANMSTHPRLKQFLEANTLDGKGKKALVVGCGMGDDALELYNLGFDVTAFDVSPSAVAICKERFSDTEIVFTHADLLKGIPQWKHKFDLVLEIFTIQALPPKYEELSIKNISDFVGENGELIVITEIEHTQRDFENGPPWLLTNDYKKMFAQTGLTLTSCSASKELATMGDEIHLSIFKRV